MDNSKELCLEFLKTNNINPFKVKAWEEMLNCKEFKIEDYDTLILYFAMNLNRGLTHYSYKSKEPQFLDMIKEIIYKNLTDKRTRGKIDVMAELNAVVIGEFAEKITNNNSAIISIFTSFIVLGIINVGIDSWCTYYEKNRREDNETDK